MGGKRPVRRPRNQHPRHHSRHRHEGGNIFAPNRLAVHVARQMHRRVPPPRNRQTICLDPRDAACCPSHRNRAQTQPPAGGNHLTSGKYRHVNVRHRVGAGIDQRRHPHPRAAQIPRRSVPVVVVGEYRHFASGYHAKTMQIGSHRMRHHHAGSVIAGKGNHPLVRPSRQNRSLGNNPPKRLVRPSRTIRQMVGNPFQRPIRAAVISSGHAGAQHDAHVGHRPQFRNRRLCPIHAGLPANLNGLAIQPPARDEIFLAKYNLRPPSRGRQSRRQPRRARTDHQHITKRPGLVIDPRIGMTRQSTQTGRPSDQRLIDPLPKRLRPHEGLVVKPGAQKWRQQIIQRQRIKLQ